MTESAEVTLSQHSLNGLKDESYFPAPAQNLFVCELLSVFGFADARDRQLAGFEATNIIGVLLWADKFVMAAAYEFQKMVQELRGVRSADIVVQPQLADVAAQKDPQLLVIQNFEVTLLGDEQVVAKRVKGFDLQPFGASLPKFRLHPLPHFIGGINGVGDGQDLIGTSAPLFNQAGD